MFEKISMKDIIAINQQFAEGRMVNESSLHFGLDRANQSGSWLQGCAHIVRAVLIDHVFEDGNKRTSAAIIASFFDDNDLAYHPEKITKTIILILKKNITSINELEKVIKNAIV